MATRRLTIRRSADFGTAVAEARRARALTQDDLAVRSGIERSYLARLEAGLSVVLLDRIVALLRRLGATITVEFPAESSGPT